VSACAAQVQDAYTVLLREKKLPMSLLEDPEKVARAGGKAARSHLLATQVHFCHSAILMMLSSQT
jgi:NGP1NT (NUC091) domain